MTLAPNSGEGPPGTLSTLAPVRLSPAQANGILLLAALAWGLGNVSQKTILDHLDPYTANGITSILGALVLAPLAQAEGRKVLPPATGMLWQLLPVALVFTMAATLMQVAYGLTTVTNAGFLVNSAAVLTPVLAWVFLRQRPALLIWPASLAVLAGVFLMGGGRMSALSPGDLLSLGAAFCFAAWTLLVGTHVMRYRRPALLTTVQLALCGVACCGIGWALHGLPTGTAVLAALPEILLLGLVSKGLAYGLMALAQQTATPSCAGILVSAEAVFGAAAAMIILAETPGPLRMLGALCIIIGVVLASRSAEMAPPPKAGCKDSPSHAPCD